ncbi:MAG TPA: BadF/BadG/BcrA/BcrD ATPase family protein [Terriglobia bacterium]|nr:BadF/BadG/BcrA/BcrD ATPase family protein [Terriglobia bacterium]
MSHLLGIDGGGTRTTAWLTNERGRVVARAEAGPSNPLKVGFESAECELLRAARLAKRRAHVNEDVLGAVCVGLAGVDRPQVHRPLLTWLHKSIPARHHLLTSDAAIALQAAVGDSPGIMVISGTGSIGYGRDQHGRVLRSGGWGTTFDDVGSGYDLGRKAIGAALRALDGRGRRTRLESKVCRALHLHDITQVILRPLAPHQIAALFPLVLEAARDGDRVARELCEDAGRELADIAVALLDRFGWRRRRVPVACSGGVFASSLQIRRSFARHLRRRAPHARVILLRRPAVEGAIALARALASGTKAAGAG